ncbi:MAG: AI-2E family transporter [Minwuia sp.]|uniref:AI-2E family transporter n=1 Tax=Minwuia sp. TaxID=2493630 RepID=UPI003A8C7917
MTDQNAPAAPRTGVIRKRHSGALFSISFWTLAVFLVIAVTAVLGRDSGPFILAGALALIGSPAFASIRRRTGMSRTMAALIVTAGMVAVIALALTLLAGPLAVELTSVADRLPGFLDSVSERLENAFRNGLGNGGAGSENAEEAASEASATLDLAEKWAVGGLATLFDTIFFVVITPFTLLFLLRDGHHAIGIIDRALPTGARADVRELGSAIRNQLAAYVRGQTFLCVTQAVTHVIGLWAVGLNFAVLLGILTGLATAIPVIGNIVMFSICMVIAVFQFETILPILGVAVVFGFSQLLETVVLSPLLVGKPTQLHPIWVVLAVLIGGNAMGILGALLGLPVAAAIKAILQFAAERRARGELELRRTAGEPR